MKLKTKNIKNLYNDLNCILLVVPTPPLRAKNGDISQKFFSAVGGVGTVVKSFFYSCQYTNIFIPLVLKWQLYKKGSHNSLHKNQLYLQIFYQKLSLLRTDFHWTERLVQLSPFVVKEATFLAHFSQSSTDFLRVSSVSGLNMVATSTFSIWERTKNNRHIRLQNSPYIWFWT